MEKRITILDGLRVAAVLMVSSFHYYSRFYGEFYSYKINTEQIFKHGYLGVELFFIISGFVITLTLDKSKDFIDFMKKRFFRLWPGMLSCSILTFSIMIVFDNGFLFPQSHLVKNVMLSNTFANPTILNTLFQIKFSYTDSAYWSLWVEICFYVIVSVLYFMDKKNLYRNFGVLTLIFISLYYVITSESFSSESIYFINAKGINFLKNLFFLFQISKMGLWFYLGMLLLKMFNTRDKKTFFLFTILFLLQALLLNTLITTIFCLLIYIILLLFIYKPHYLLFLRSPNLSVLGISSYSFYLIHQHVGILIINKLSRYFGNYNILIGVFLIICFFIFSVFNYKLIEKPMSKSLKRIFTK